MKTWKRLLSAVLAFVLLLAPVTMLPAKAAQTNAAAENTLYVFDMETFLGEQTRQIPYDYLKFATALQGLANRERPQVFFDSLESSVNLEAGIDVDDDWLDYITDPANGSNMLTNGEDISDYNIVRLDGTMANFWALVSMFRGYADGLVLWDTDVGATANVASTIAGAEDLLPVRYATGRDDLYTQLMNGNGGKWTVKRSLVGLFDGETIPTFESSKPGAERKVDTSLESTKSTKNDAYIWAMEHYLKEGKTNANLMAYALDGRSDDYSTVNPDHPVNAQVVMSNIPTAMQAGSVIPVSITVKNTGEIDWEMTNNETWPNPVRLARVDEIGTALSVLKSSGNLKEWVDFHATHFQMLKKDAMLDPSKTGGLEGIPEFPAGGKASRLDISKKVAVGEEYTFNFYLMAPTEPGSYELRLVMLQDTANANFPSGVFGQNYYAGVEVTEGPVEHNDSQIIETEDSVEYLCAYDAMLHTEKGKGAYDVTKDLAALQAHMVYPHAGAVKFIVGNVGDTTWTADDGYALRYAVDDGQWATLDLGTDVIEPGESKVFEIPVSAADVAEDGKSAQNVLPAGTELEVVAQMTKGGMVFGETFSKTVTVKPSFAGKLVSHTIPDEIIDGSKQAVALTYLNTGSFTWTGAKTASNTAGLRIAITTGARYLSTTSAVDDVEVTHGYNCEMQTNYDVRPGESYTFHVDLHTYPNPLSSTTVADEKTTSNAAKTLNFIVNTQGDLAGNQQFSENYKYVVADHVVDEMPTTAVVINDDNSYGDDMIFATEDIPGVMTVNEIKQITLTLENTGTSTWYTTDHPSEEHQIGTDENGDPIYCEGSLQDICTVDIRVLDENFKIYNGFTSQNEDGTLEGAWGSRGGKGYQVPGLWDIAPGETKVVRPYLYAPSKPGVYVLRITMSNPSGGDECFRTGYEKIIRVIEADTERENDDGSIVYLDANYRPSLSQEAHHCDDADAEMTENEMDSRFLSVRIPTMMATGETTPIAVTVKNVGTKHWNRYAGQNAADVATNARLDVMGSGFTVTKDRAGVSGWVGDKNVVEMDTGFNVYPGSATTFTGYLHAPATVGVLPLRVQMSNSYGKWGFGENLRLEIPVGMNAEITAVGQLEALNNMEDALTLRVKNTGEAAWDVLSAPSQSEGYVLKYTFGGKTTYLSVPQSTAINRYADFVCKIERPYEAGSYPFTAEMIYRTADGKEYTLGTPMETSVTIEESATTEQTLTAEEQLAVTDAEYGVQLVSAKLPKTMKPGERLPIAVTVKNTGTGDLISKFGTATGNADGVRVYFNGQGFTPNYKEDQWQSNPNAFDVVNTTDYKLAMADKFFLYNNNGDGRTVSRYGVTINDRSNTECNCLDMKDGTILSSGDTYTYVGWIVAPYTAGSYDIKIFATADVNKEIRSTAHTVNIVVGESSEFAVKDFSNKTYDVGPTVGYGKVGLFNSALPSADYYIANKAFFWDLSPDDTIAPMDDRTQPVGTDVATLRKLLHAQMQQAQSRRSSGNLDVEGTGIFTVGGFYPWAYKYSYDVDSQSLMDPFHGEWNMVDILSEYGGQTDADAYGTIGLSNASVYQHIAVNLSGSAAVQMKNTFNPKTYCTEAYNPNKNYIMFYMGDYDGASWVGNLIDPIYNEKDENGNLTRGDLPLAWQINSNLADRIPHVYNMLYKNATTKDFFVAGNNGTGYFNVGWALNPRDPSITDAQTAQLREDWIAYNKSENQEFRLGITGFVQPTTSGKLTEKVMDVYRETTPYGVADCRGVYVGQQPKHHGIYEANEADGGTPFTYDTQLPRLPTIAELERWNADPVTYADKLAEYETTIGKCLTTIRNAMNNNNGIVSASSVKWTPSQVQMIVDRYNKTYPNAQLTVVDPYTYFRIYRQSLGSNVGMQEYPEIKFAGANVSFGESLRLAMAYTFEGLDLTGIDMSKKSGIIVWREASEASHVRISLGDIIYGEQIDGLQLMPGTSDVYVGETSAYVAKDVDKYLYIRAFVSLPAANGTYNRLYVSPITAYSPKVYAENMADSGSAELKDLVVSMLNYAAEAQTYAGEVRDADNTLTAAEKKLTFDPKSIRQPAAINPSKTTTDTAGYFPKAYQNIRLNDNFNLLFFWQADPAVYANATDSGVLVWTEAQYNALKGAPSVSNAGTKLPMTSTTINGATCYGAEYSGIAARSIDQTVYACAYMTIDGVTYYSDLVNYSIHRYAQNMISRGGVMGTLAKRVIVYGEAAKAYYESK